MCFPYSVELWGNAGLYGGVPYYTTSATDGCVAMLGVNNTEIFQTRFLLLESLQWNIIKTCKPDKGYTSTNNIRCYMLDGPSNNQIINS